MKTARGTLLANFTGKIAPAFPRAINLTLHALASHRKASASPDGHCNPNSVFQKKLGKHEVVIGGAWSIIRGVKMDFTYLTGQSSSLGFATSATGESGSWSASSTLASSRSTEQDFPTFYGPHSHHYLTVFKYGQYQITPATCTPYQQAQEDGFVGGAIEKRASRIKTIYCTEYQGKEAGTVLKKNSAYTFGTGVGITDVLGFNLSAETGYDTQATVGFHNARGGTRLLCGSNTYPGAYPARAQWGRHN